MSRHGWSKGPFRKLYCEETPSFGALTLGARALAAYLLKLADDAGRIYVGRVIPADAIARRAGATTGDRRLLRKQIPELLREGFLVRDGQYLLVRNFASDHMPLELLRAEWDAIRDRLTSLVLAEHGSRCVYCRLAEATTVDHVDALARGGTNDLRNLVPACQPCNSSKGTKTIDEWKGQAS